MDIGEKQIFEPKKSKFQGISKGCGAALRRPEIFYNVTFSSTKIA